MSEKGRSMVEMLGVLAIIGVLSVGAIAGYSKAMFKYKINRQAEQLNMVINAVGRNALNFKDVSGYITSYFIKMGEIPVEMIRKNTNDRIYDIFGNSVVITANDRFVAVFLLSSGLDTSSVRSLEICRNFITIAKENSGNVSHFSTISNYGEEEQLMKSLYGDNKCTTARACLKNVTLDEIYDICTVHISKKDAHMKIVWEYKYL